MELAFFIGYSVCYLTRMPIDYYVFLTGSKVFTIHLIHLLPDILSTLLEIYYAETRAISLIASFFLVLFSYLYNTSLISPFMDDARPCKYLIQTFQERYNGIEINCSVVEDHAHRKEFSYSNFFTFILIYVHTGFFLN